MSKKWMTCILVLFAVVSLALAAGAKSAAAADSVTLRFAHHDPPMGPGGKACEAYAKKIEEVSKGAVKVNMFPASALAQGNATYDAVKSSVADIGWSVTGLYPGRFPLFDIVSQPYLDLNSSLKGSLTLWNNFQKFPEIQKEFDDVKVLVVHTHQGAPIGTRKTPVKSVAEFKGLKIRTTAGGALQWLKAAGAIPMTMPPIDMYTNMEKGVIDGWTIDMIGAEAFKMHEVTQYYILPYYYVNTFWVVMNKNAWGKLSPDVQKAIEGVSGEWAIRNIFSKSWDSGDKEAYDRMKIKPEQIITLPDAEVAKAKEISKSVWAEEIKSLEGKGKPAQKVFDETMKFISSYK